MTSAIPYDPDDFDNNPFAEQSTHSLIPEQQQQNDTINNDDDMNNETTRTSQPGPQETMQQPVTPANVPKSSIDDADPVAPLNRRPNDQEIKKFLPERFMKDKFSIKIEIEDVEKNGNNSASNYKNPIVLLNASVRGLPGYRKTVYKNIRRTYKELELFNTFLSLNNLEVFVPALPVVPTLYNFGSEEFKTSLIESLQTWLNRICSNAILIKNSEFVLFLENSNFHYSPSRTKPSNIVMAIGLKRKTLKQLQIPYDECQELAGLRPMIKATYVESSKMRDHLINVDKLDKKISQQNSELNNKIGELSETEPDEMMKKAWVKISKNLNIVNEVDLIKKHTTNLILTDYLNLVADDTYTIKECLTNRHLLMRELINAEDSTKRKHASIAKLRNKTVIDPAKVDEAILSLEQATLAEKKLRRDVIRTTYNMLLEQDEYMQFLTSETRKLFKNLTLKTIENERKKLAVLENYRNDFREISNIRGGLSRLGRENYPVSPVRQQKSQTSEGDSWNNRVKKRTEVPIPNQEEVESLVDQLNSADIDARTGSSLLGDDDDDDSGAIVNAKSAASLLGPSTF